MADPESMSSVLVSATTLLVYNRMLGRAWQFVEIDDHENFTAPSIAPRLAASFGELLAWLAADGVVIGVYEPVALVLKAATARAPPRAGVPLAARRSRA